MTRITITTIATASIRERWQYEVTDAVAAILTAEPERALDLLADNELTGEFISVEDEVTGDERDREVDDITIDRVGV